MRVGFAEMQRLIRKAYPETRAETFMESCGVADLITTCYGELRCELELPFLALSSSSCVPSYPISSSPIPSYPTPSYPTPSYPTPSYTTPSYTTPSYNTPSYTTPSYITPSYPIFSYPIPSYPIPSYPTPSHTRTPTPLPTPNRRAQ